MLTTNPSKSSQTQPRPNRLLVTTGEPSGIGMDIVIDVLVNHPKAIAGFESVIILADQQAFLQRAGDLLATGLIDRLPVYQTIKKTDQMDFNKLEGVCLLDLSCQQEVVAGRLSVANAKMVLEQLNLAHQLAYDCQIGAIVTAPIQKSVMVDAGICLEDGQMFSGHTEFFMQKSGCDKVVMMLANSAMKVALVTTHLPLKEVAAAITDRELTRTVQITHQALVDQFGFQDPCILVCGLNPHAGEGGHLGSEEITIINPVLQTFQDQGMNISLAMPADTLFTKTHLQRADAVIAMYHDQGLAPLKSHGFGDTVNITLGLPYIRTSVDHGTALDLAATGKASSSSLLQAIYQAKDMLNAQKTQNLL